MIKSRVMTIFVFSALLLAGCSSIQPCNTDNELLCDLYKTGVTETNTRRMVFEGSESNFGPIRVEVNKDTTDNVWSMLHRSELGGRHYACGWVTIEFYNSRYRTKPNASLQIICGGNDSGMYVTQSKRTIYDKKTMRFIGLYQCAGLEQYVMKFLEEEYRKKNKD
jgi:hypothetical protein